MEVVLDKDLEQYAKFPELYKERKKARPYPRQTLRFLDLPVEIRVMIYQYLLRHDKSFELWAESGAHLFHEKYRTGEVGSWYDYVRFKRKLRVLRLNKQINKEAAEVFYGENAFRFTSAGGFSTLNSFMATIGSANTRFLRKITIHIPTASRRNNFRGDLVDRLRRRGMVTHFGPQGRGAGDSVKEDFFDTLTNLARLAEDGGGGGGVALKELELILPHDKLFDHRKRKWGAFHCTQSLKDSIEGLHVSLVLHHGTFGSLYILPRHHFYDALAHTRAVANANVPLFQELVHMGWSLRHVHDFKQVCDRNNCFFEDYDVLEDEYIMEDLIPGWTVAALENSIRRSGPKAGEGEDGKA